jgi:Uma2 family endonuclease
MSTELHRRYTLEEYLNLDRASEVRYEYWDGEVFAMSGASPQHDQIFINLVASLRTQLRGRPCRVFSSDMRLKVPSLPPYRYPDLSALCGEPHFELIGGVQALTNPSLIIEILSPTTEAFDRGDKFTHYKSIPEFSEYLLVAQHRPHFGHYLRQDDGSWNYREVNELMVSLPLFSIDCVLALDEVYQDVEFKPQIGIGNSERAP